MNLKKIELYGFKSFADKLVIDFKSNITGIVGPNGCGKSNVADAVRWVLGEQSPSVLRCKKMPEVIFGGTATRKSLSYCEVSLYLDNSQKQYPVDYEEVVITRKLYRSGDSEYYINRNACRLKDIVDLFRDSGIGREGYSIIGQGKIEDILSQKPEARRQIFEEAAGISRHKARKIETERKLERTRDNISRINDIITEVESKLGPLEQEAKDAAKVKELKKNLKLIDVFYFLHQCENSSNERDKIKAKLNKLSAELETLEREQEKLNSEYNIAMLDIANSDNYGNRLRDRIMEFMVNAERKEGESRLISERLNNLRKEAQNIATETIQLETRLADRENEKREKTALYNEKNFALAEKKKIYAALQEEYAAVSAAVESQEKTIEMSNRLLIDSIGRLSEIGTDKVKLELERDILIDSLGSAKEAYKEKKAAYDAAVKVRDGLRAELDELLAERARKAEDKASAEKNYSDSLNELRETENKKRQLESRRSELEIKIRMVEEYIRDYSGYGETVRRLMNEAQNDKRVASMILGAVGEVISVPKDLQLAVEIALGGAIQDIITETEKEASALIDILREKGFGRATFLPLSAVKPNPFPREHYGALDEDGAIGIASELIKYERRFNNVISNLLGKTLIAEDKESAIKIAKKYGYGFRIVTLDGVLFQQSGAITGGSAPGRNTRILSRESELDDLNKKLKNAEKELIILTADTEDLARESGDLEKAVRVIDARLHKLDVEIENLNVRLSGADSEAGMYKAEADKILASNSAAAQRIEELNAEIKKAEKSKSDLEGERTSADDFINEAKDKFFNDKQKRDALGKRVTEAMMEVNTLQNELENISREISLCKTDIAYATQGLLDLRARKATNEKEIRDAEVRIDTAAFTDDEKAELQRMKQEVAELDEHKKNMQTRVAELDIERSNTAKSVAEVTEKKIREESALERIDIDIENLSVRIGQDYDMDYDAAKAFKEEHKDFAFDPSKAQAESVSLRRKIERLGPVNELAEEQFSSERIRHEEMKKQYDDLVKTEADLVKIIASLTAEMMQKFTESFKKINDNFQEVFRELFGGGSAKLELEKGEGVSVLDAGIEIMAEPPGKRLTRISLLSGGERALTAIAILFAIIKLKPMPFSILDEIEAALDEANASLFAQYLRKFAAFTQFIVITHRKPTMALADMLYGVTMQEKGISKLVSVQLADALKTAEEVK